MAGYDVDVSSLTIGNAILKECFKYEQTSQSTSAYDLSQYITILDAYLDKHHKGTFDHYVYVDDMFIPMIIKQKFSGMNMNLPIKQYIPSAGEKVPMVQDPQILALASYVVTTFFSMSPIEKDEWINKHCIFEQLLPDYNTFRLYSANLSIV